MILKYHTKRKSAYIYIPNFFILVILSFHEPADFFSSVDSQLNSGVFSHTAVWCIDLAAGDSGEFHPQSSCSRSHIFGHTST